MNNIKIAFTILSLCGFSISGCGSEASSGPTDTNTNWLKACDDDAECGSSLACLCGVCSESCSDSSSCAAFDEQAVCREEAELCGSGSVSLCALPETTLSGSGPGSSGGGSSSEPGGGSGGESSEPEGGASSGGGTAGGASGVGGDSDGSGGEQATGGTGGTTPFGGAGGLSGAGGAAVECTPPAGMDLPAETYTVPAGCSLPLDAFGSSLVVSEAQFKMAYSCLGDAESGIDFETKQLYLVFVAERTQASLNYVHIDDAGDVVVGVESPVYCGGAAPPNTVVPVLMDKSVRPPSSTICSSGMCQGPPVP